MQAAAAGQPVGHSMVVNTARVLSSEVANALRHHKPIQSFHYCVADSIAESCHVQFAAYSHHPSYQLVSWPASIALRAGLSSQRAFPMFLLALAFHVIFSLAARALRNRIIRSAQRHIPRSILFRGIRNAETRPGVFWHRIARSDGSLHGYSDSHRDAPGLWGSERFAVRRLR